MSNETFVVALGATTSIGRDAWSSAAAVRAGVNRFGDHPFMVDTAGEPMRVARVEWLDLHLRGTARHETLLLPAIRQALDCMVSTDSLDLRIGCTLGLPSPRPGLPTALQPDLIATIDTHLGKVVESAVAFPLGHSAGLVALDAACTWLREGRLDACVVAAVDSYLEPESLEWLESSEQLHGAGPLNNAWGFIPGEGAGALLLMTAAAVRRTGVRPFAQVLGVGRAVEDKRISTRTICVGEGLTEALRVVLASIPLNARFTDVYCDMNGEPYRADEYGFAALRTRDSFRAASEFVAPADCWGDVGAASGPLLAILAVIAGCKHYAHGEVSLAWTSAEGGERAAAALRTLRRSGTWA